MRNSTLVIDGFELPLRETYGRISRRYLPAVAAVPKAAVTATAQPDRTVLRNEVEAYALRALTANGYGDAAVGRTAQYAHLASDRLGPQARRHRAYQLTGAVDAALRALGAMLRRMHANWKRRQLARDTYFALRELDARTLRDLGFHRSEIRSVAAEIAGDADSPRAYPERIVRGLY